MEDHSYRCKRYKLELRNEKTDGGQTRILKVGHFFLEIRDAGRFLNTLKR